MFFKSWAMAAGIILAAALPAFSEASDMNIEYGIDCRETFRSFWGAEDWWNDLVLNQKIVGNSKDSVAPLLWWEACEVEIGVDNVKFTCPDFYEPSSKNPEGSVDIAFYPKLPAFNESGFIWREHGVESLEAELFACTAVSMRPIESVSEQVGELYCAMTNIQGGVMGQNDSWPLLDSNNWYTLRLPQPFLPSSSEDYQERVYELGPGMNFWYGKQAQPDGTDVLVGVIYLDIPTPGFAGINTLNRFSQDNTRVQYRCFDRKLEFMSFAFE